MSFAGEHPLDNLRTARLSLTAVRAADLADFQRMHRDPRVMATLGGPWSEEHTAARLGEFVAHWRTHGFGLWTLRDRESGRFAGRGGLRHVTVAGRDEVEVAYALMPGFWGRGLATELAVESVRVGFERLGREDLVCFTLTTNRASRRVMEKAGFRRERVVSHAGQPHLLCRLTAAAWRAR